MVLSRADIVLMVIAQTELSMIDASIVNIRTLYKCMDGEKASSLTALSVEKKQFFMTMQLFMEAISLLTTVLTVELKWIW